MPLTMTPSMWTGDAPQLNPPTTENTVQYQVRGLPNDHHALIGHKPHTHPVRWWFVVHTSPDARGDWHGDYATPEEALAALSKDFPS
jgi:hypothetical protein